MTVPGTALGSTSPDVSMVFPEGRGVAAWQARGKESPVPGAWPYGLDQLAQLGARISEIELKRMSPLRRRWLRLMLTRRRSTCEGAALCWDERNAFSMVDQVASKSLFSGVIWATDQVAAGQRSSDLDQARKALRLLDGVWTLNRKQVPLVQDWLGPTSPGVHYVPFGIDSDFYGYSPYPAKPLVASVGGDRDRDPKTLFAALRIVKAKRPDVDCVVQSRSELPLPDGIERVASLPHHQVRALYARASVVAVATRPNLHVSGMTVALEAMSVGRPVVVSDSLGMEDYVLDGRTGVVTPTGDADSMAAAILSYLASPEKARDVGLAGRQHVENAHTTSTMCRALLDMMAAPS